jgi:hypothetical protein
MQKSCVVVLIGNVQLLIHAAKVFCCDAMPRGAVGLSKDQACACGQYNDLQL